MYFSLRAMNEPPGARARVGLTGLTVAEYFRDFEGQDVLFFVDNIFRFTCKRTQKSQHFLDASHLLSATSQLLPLTWVVSKSALQLPRRDRLRQFRQFMCQLTISPILRLQQHLLTLMLRPFCPGQ